MGVFTVGRQVALEIDMPGWWLANASVDMDFRRGLYYDSSTANPRAATDFLSCTRASVGYAKNADGTLSQFASNVLRLGTIGLLVEGARTNYCTQSQTLDNAPWNPISITTTANQAAAPDGTTTMDKIVDTTSSDRHIAEQVIPVDPGTVQTTLSVFVKDVDRRYVQLLASDSVACRVYIFADLSTGTITDSGTDIGTDLTVNSSSIEAYTNGIYRISMTVTPATQAVRRFVVGLSDRSTYVGGTISNGSPFYLGSGKSIYAWGAQAEPGAFPSSYIPTIGASATRAAENITISSSLQTAINAATGSLVAQTDNGGGASFAANIVDSNGTNLLGFDASNHALASMIGALATANTANRTTQDKLGLAWNASGRSLVLNGGTVATDASAQTPSATQHIGSTGSANFAYAYIERLSAWTTKLADATLQGFTV